MNFWITLAAYEAAWFITVISAGRVAGAVGQCDIRSLAAARVAATPT